MFEARGRATTRPRTRNRNERIMAEVPYHKAADPEVQASGLPGNDRTNHEAMLAYVKAMESDDPTDRSRSGARTGPRRMAVPEKLVVAMRCLKRRGTVRQALTEVGQDPRRSSAAHLSHRALHGRFVKDIKWSPDATQVPATERSPLELPRHLPLREVKIVRSHATTPTSLVKRVHSGRRLPW